MAFNVGSRSFATVEELEKLVVHCATEYELNGYVEDFDGVEVSDPEYDELYKALKAQKPTSSAFKGTSPSTAKVTGKVVKHDPPMTSIDKADGEPADKEKTYKGWIDGCAKRLSIPASEIKLAQEYKHDGVAVRINYVDGKLVSAGLRPRDGVNGTDVTEHVKHVLGVPTTLRLPLTLSLNGEIECWNDDFEAINKARDTDGEEPYKNPRNYTAGCMGRDDPDELKEAKLRITFHSIVNFDEWETYYDTVIERAKWANSKDGLGLQDDKGKGFFVQSRDHIFRHLQMMEDHAKKLPYYTDGVVLKVNDLNHYDELGHSNDDPVKPPRGALAWKFAEEVAQATTKHLEWNASRTGRVVPTAIFDKPVRLADTDVLRATCNNYGWASKMGIGVGTVVSVKKAGKIVPNVMGVISGAVADIKAPTDCPTCGSKLRLNTSASGNTDLLCDNADCGAKQVHSWIFYIAKMGGKGLGTSAMEKILATGKVKCLPDLYALSVDDLVAADFSERQATLALATIFVVPAEKDNAALRTKIEAAQKGKQKIEAWKFFAALGIPGAGETAGKALVNHYKDFAKIRAAKMAELEVIAGIGPKTAQAIGDWFSHQDAMVGKLLDHVELELPKTGKLTGQNFCLTGSFDLGKKHWQKKIEDEGGNVQSSVGKTTNYLVQQHGKSDGSPSEKEQKAVKQGVPIISVTDLEKLL